jgi:hypothetical protein
MSEIKHKFMQLEKEIKKQEILLQKPKITIGLVLITAIEFLICTAVIVFALFCISPDEEIIKLFLFIKEIIK